MPTHSTWTSLSSLPISTACFEWMKLIIEKRWKSIMKVFLFGVRTSDVMRRWHLWCDSTGPHVPNRSSSIHTIQFSWGFHIQMQLSQHDHRGEQWVILSRLSMDEPMAQKSMLAPSKRITTGDWVHVKDRRLEPSKSGPLNRWKRSKACWCWRRKARHEPSLTHFECCQSSHVYFVIYDHGHDFNF